VLAVLSALIGLASMSTDLYLPAMPAMSRSLGASAGAMEWTVSGYLIGFSLGQLLWGPWAAGFRWPLGLCSLSSARQVAHSRALPGR
jgi:MFS transporter, DHA1 family, multidrug resistance protein